MPPAWFDGIEPYPTTDVAEILLRREWWNPMDWRTPMSETVAFHLVNMFQVLCAMILNGFVVWVGFSSRLHRTNPANLLSILFCINNFVYGLCVFITKVFFLVNLRWDRIHCILDSSMNTFALSSSVFAMLTISMERYLSIKKLIKVPPRIIWSAALGAWGTGGLFAFIHWFFGPNPTISNSGLFCGPAFGVSGEMVVVTYIDLVIINFNLLTVVAVYAIIIKQLRTSFRKANLSRKNQPPTSAASGPSTQQHPSSWGQNPTSVGAMIVDPTLKSESALPEPQQQQSPTERPAAKSVVIHIPGKDDRDRNRPAVTVVNGADVPLPASPMDDGPVPRPPPLLLEPPLPLIEEPNDADDESNASAEEADGLSPQQPTFRLSFVGVGTVARERMMAQEPPSRASRGSGDAVAGRGAHLTLSRLTATLGRQMRRISRVQIPELGIGVRTEDDYDEDGTSGGGGDTTDQGTSSVTQSNRTGDWVGSHISLNSESGQLARPPAAAAATRTGHTASPSSPAPGATSPMSGLTAQGSTSTTALPLVQAGTRSVTSGDGSRSSGPPLSSPSKRRRKQRSEMRLLRAEALLLRRGLLVFLSFSSTWIMFMIHLFHAWITGERIDANVDKVMTLVICGGVALDPLIIASQDRNFRRASITRLRSFGLWPKSKKSRGSSRSKS
ncbi:hypothetical protein H9P43_004268 [Blastocladiella emersonii ATCC 22665]|nr:hypothetical protein H9P43_004268 [Blastocladiella emersonii ATCC 22665]